MTDYLFVYGTLRTGAGHPLHDALERWATLVGPGAINARLYDLGAYPGAVLLPGDHLTRGEVWQLHADHGRLLEVLDRYEGIRPGSREASLYERIAMPVELEDGRLLDAMTYIYRGTLTGQPVVPGGDWLAYERRVTELIPDRE